MIVSKINFTSSNFDNFSLKKPTQTPTVMAQQNSVPTNNDEQNRNKNNLKKYTLIGAGIILATFLAFKGKSILNKFKTKTILEKTPQTPEIKLIKEEPKIEKPVKPILPDRYALVDEYDKRTQARVKFRNKTRGRALTPAEKAESDRLRLEWCEIYDRLIPEHQSIVKTKTAADFTSEADKQNYIMHYVLPRMGKSEESALDGLDMFEQFGFRADYPNHFDSTISKLSDGIYTIHKECRSDKLLNRFVEVFGKFADNKPHYHPDDDGLAAVLTYFVKKRDDIQESTVLKAIELMKKIISQKANYERLERTLVSSIDAKYKNSEPIKKALEELKVISKDMQYRLGADDK